MTVAARRVGIAACALLASGTAVAEPAVRAPAAEEGWFLAADRTRIFYRKVGRGPRVTVFVHGGPGSNFRGAGDDLEALAGGGRTFISYDQRGSGYSQLVTDPAQLTAQAHVRDLEALRRHFGARRMSLVGLSWGAALSALYAAGHPTRVERLLLISPMAPSAAFFQARLQRLAELLGPEGSARRKELLARVPSADDVETVATCRELSDGVFRHYFVEATPARLALAARHCDIPPAAIRNRPVVEAGTLGSLGSKWDLRPTLAKIAVPTLVVEGAQSKVPLDATREWAAVMPAARLLLIPDAGHEVFADQPAAFLAAARRFLGGRFPEGVELVGEADAH